MLGPGGAPAESPQPQPQQIVKAQEASAAATPVREQIKNQQEAVAGQNDKKTRERGEIVRIGQTAEDGLSGKIKTSEALAGVLSVGFKDRFIVILNGVREKLTAKLINKELSPEETEAYKKNLDAFEEHANGLAEKYMEKSVKGISEEDQLGEIKSYTDSEIIKIIAELRGEKQLDPQFKENPIDAVDDFFRKNIKKITTDAKTRAQVAQRMGIPEDKLMTKVSAYDEALTLEQNLNKWHDQVFGEPLYKEKDSKSNPYLKKGAMVGGILSALMALQVWQAMKKEQGQGGQQMG